MIRTGDNTNPWKVFIMESERGWGSRLDEVKYFATLEEATDFVAKYNAHNDKKTVPDWYMYAENPVANENATANKQN